jgi:hypothetical protein
VTVDIPELGKLEGTDRLAPSEDPELFYGLTIWDGFGSMQVRDTGVALAVMDNAPRSSEMGRPVLLTNAEARRIRDLLNIATARGFLED